MTFKLDPKKYEGHTEGPWKWHRHGCKVRGLNSHIIADVSVSYANEDELNARGILIADAPDILAYAVRLEAEKAELVEALEYQKKMQNGDASCDLTTFLYKRDQALHKAKGGE